MSVRFSNKIFFALLMVIAVSLAGCAPNGVESGSAAESQQVGQVASITVADTIETSGSLSASLLANLSWQTSGIVDAIHVEVGQTVKAGDVLASLRANTVPANIISAQSELVSAKRNLDEVLHSNLSKAQAQQTLAEAQSAFKDAENGIASFKNKRGSSEDIAYQQSQVALAQQQVDRAQAAYDQVSGLSDADPRKSQAYSTLYTAKQNYTRMVATLNWYTSTPSTTEYDKKMAAYELAKAKLENAQREWERLKDGPDPDDVATAQARVAAAQATVNAINVIAPFDGEVLFIATSPGRQAANGAAALVVANRNTLIVDALVDELDIARVQLGNQVTITLDALPDIALTGKVAAIDPVGSTVSGLVKYTVTISVDPVTKPLFFGATADVIITVSDPRDMLAVPIGAVQNDNQGEYVLRVTANETERVNVTSDSIQGELVALSSTDLKVGDQVLIVTSNVTTATGGFGSPGGGPGGIFVP